ncbi:hypothetical protein OH76DRAFT_1265096 [Lentinus brumalis]|uniref:Uncharacterized protein n=1 Tax=Lentinus brumalis TaxID=2498619 RepID=A0A371CRB8_9APHY|nr:hypothetical protein OH76DRAFT_1265096 [Polyporus brumalis]
MLNLLGYSPDRYHGCSQVVVSRGLHSRSGPCSPSGLRVRTVVSPDTISTLHFTHPVPGYVPAGRTRCCRCLWTKSTECILPFPRQLVASSRLLGHRTEGIDIHPCIEPLVVCHATDAASANPKVSANLPRTRILTSRPACIVGPRSMQPIYLRTDGSRDRGGPQLAPSYASPIAPLRQVPSLVLLDCRLASHPRPDGRKAS